MCYYLSKTKMAAEAREAFFAETDRTPEHGRAVPTGEKGREENKAAEQEEARLVKR